MQEGQEKLVVGDRREGSVNTYLSHQCRR